MTVAVDNDGVRFPHCLFLADEFARTRLATRRLGGGGPSQAKKRGVARAGAQRLHGPRFLPEGLGLDGPGAAGPN
jgi:hypothetical protein